MKKLICVLLTLMMILSCTCAFAEDTSLADIQTKGKLIMGFDDAYPPMGFEEDGEYKGFDIELAKEVAKRMNIELVLQPISWEAKEMELNNGNIDCIWSGMTITPERQEQLLFSMPYLANQQILVVKSGSGINEMADLDGKVLGTQAGSASVDVLNANADLTAMVGEPMLYDDFLIALMDLELGGIDAVLIDSVVGNYYISLMEDPDNYFVIPEILQAEEYGIGFRKADAALADEINNQLIAIANDGTLESIALTWFGEDTTLVNQYAAEYTK